VTTQRNTIIPNVDTDGYSLLADSLEEERKSINFDSLTEYTQFSLYQEQNKYWNKWIDERSSLYSCPTTLENDSDKEKYEEWFGKDGWFKAIFKCSLTHQLEFRKF